jgi:hypothetical protein
MKSQISDIAALKADLRRDERIAHVVTALRKTAMNTGMEICGSNPICEP